LPRHRADTARTARGGASPGDGRDRRAHPRGPSRAARTGGLEPLRRDTRVWARGRRAPPPPVGHRAEGPGLAPTFAMAGAFPAKCCGSAGHDGLAHSADHHEPCAPRAPGRRAPCLAGAEDSLTRPAGTRYSLPSFAVFGTAGEREVTPTKLLEMLRDRVIHRSQIGKRKLDRSATRRELDDALRVLGERFRAIVRSGRTMVPPELVQPMEEVRKLEDRLAAQDDDIAALERELTTQS